MTALLLSIILLTYTFADNRSSKCVHAAEEPGGVPGRVPGDGADGRQPLPGDTDGPGPREDELPALPDALRHQAFASRWNYTSGEYLITF